MALNNLGRYAVAYWLVLVALFLWLVHDTLQKTVNFLSAASELTEGYKLGILLNAIFVLFVMFGKLIQLVLFGELRIIEVEHIVERLPLYGINLLFNLSSDDNVIFNYVLLGATVMLKMFHIVLVDRMDMVFLRITNKADLEGYSGRQILMAFASTVFFWLPLVCISVDFLVAKFLAYDVFQGVNLVVCLLFGFQFAVQGMDLLAYNGKLWLNIYEMVAYKANIEDEFDDENDDRVWETKVYFTKAIDIASSSLKAMAHITFFYLLTFNSGLPLLMLQGTFLTLKQTYTEIMLLLLFIESSKRLDSQLPNATKEELEASDSLCIICRDDMVSSEDYEAEHSKTLPSRRYPKKLRCGHILHMGCLKDWLERSENCPLCRRNAFSEEAVPDPATSAGPQEEVRAAPAEPNIVNSLNIPAGPPEPTPSTRIYDHDTLPANLTINLPSFALVPPNWAVLPLHPGPIPGQYNVDISSTHQAQMKVVKPSGGNIEVFRYTPETNEHI